MSEPLKIRVSDRENIDFDREYVARKGLVGFVRLAWKLIEPGAPYVHGWHLDEMGAHCEAFIRGEIPRFVLNAPPGTGKSIYVSAAMHPWAWACVDPKLKFMFGSFDKTNALRDAERARKILISPWFTSRFPEAGEVLHGKSSALGFYHNTHGGFRYSSTTRGGWTGKHADVQVADDPIKPILTQGGGDKSRAELQFCSRWWSGTMASRVADARTTRRMVAMQRLHEVDLSAQAAEEGAEVLALPHRFNPKLERGVRTSIGGDRRTEAGALLFPERFPEEAVAKLERDLGPFAESQLQQNPRAGSGGVFDRDTFQHWRFETLPPAWDALITSWDLTFKDTAGSDFVCGQIWGQCGPNYYLLGRFYERIDFARSLLEVVALRDEQRSRWGRAGEVLIEDKANGPALLRILRDQIPGLVPIEPDGGKIARANAVGYLFRGGNVYFPDPNLEGYAWVREHESQCHNFPNVTHDDSVDAMTQALLYLTQYTSPMTKALQARAAKRTS